MATAVTDRQKVLFPVAMQPVYLERKRENLFQNDYRPVPGFKAIVAEDDGHVFSVVAKDYRLVTNEEALELGEVCFGEVFKVIRPEDLSVFNIIMPKTRSFCHVDFTHPETNFELFDKDQWFPYLRVTNSYNRMFALNFDLGFCRGICRNGVIFGRKNIEFKFYHSKTSKDPVVKFKLRAGEFSVLEKQFIESLRNLKRFHVPPKLMWPLACKVFGFNAPDSPTPRQKEIMEEKRVAISDLSDRYFPELGENGYAALNVLTDYASRPVGMVSVEGNIDGLQRKSGAWVTEFVDAIVARDFSFDRYLGEYVRMAG